jgi:opacity protein-like surface antigen
MEHVMPFGFPRNTLALPSCLALALATALPAQAAEGDDRFTLRLGAMNVDAEGELRGSTIFAGNDIGFSEDFDFGSTELVPRIDGVFRLGERNRLIFDYFKYDKSQQATLGEDLSYDDVTIPAGSFARGEAEFQLASLVYDFAVVDGERSSLGLQVGAEWAKLKGTLEAEAGENSYRDTASESGYAPVLGLRFTTRPSDKWLINLQGQYLDTGWGNFGDYDGSITRANAIVEYRFTPRFGAFVGYDWFKLDVEQAGSDGLLGLDQRFKGPVAGVSLAF